MGHVRICCVADKSFSKGRASSDPLCGGFSGSACPASCRLTPCEPRLGIFSVEVRTGGCPAAFVRAGVGDD